MLAACGLAAPFLSEAATRSWDGSNNTRWTTGQNWSGNTVPGSGDVASLNSAFTGSGDQPNINGNTTVGEIIFASSLARNVTISGASNRTLTLNGISGIGIDNQSSRTITINARLRLGNDQTWQGNSITFSSTSSTAINTNGNTLTLSPDSGETFDISARITGSGSLIQDGSGTTTLSGTNTYTGVTTISDGVLSVSNVANGGSNSNLGAAGATASNLVINGGTLRFTGAADSTNRLFTIGTSGATIDASGTGALSLTGTGSIVSSGTGNRTLTLTGSNTDSNTLAGVLANPSSGTLSLVKDGAGTWVLSGASTYTGVTTLSDGVLSVSSLANGGSNSNIGASSNSASNLVFNGGTLRYTGPGSSTNRSFTLGVNGGTIDASGTGALNFTNTGSLSYSGSGNRTLTLTGTSTAINNLSADLANGSGGATSLVKNGSGTWRISGDNTLTGSITVNDGLLQLNSSTINGGVPGALVVGDGTGAADSAIARNMQEGQVGNTSTVTVYSDGWFDINAAAYPDKGGDAGWREETVGQINLYGGHITTGTAGSLNIDPSLPGAGITSHASSQTALIDAPGGLVDFKGLTRTVSVEDGSPTTDLEIRGALVNGGVTKTGDGRLSFTGTAANTYTGPTTVNGGTLELAKSSGVTSIASSSIAVNSGGTLLLGNSNQINDSAALTLDGGTLSTGETTGFAEKLGTLTLSSSSTIDLGSGLHLLEFDDSSSLTWSGTLTIYDWAGTEGHSGTQGRIFVGTDLSGLTSAQLAQVTFDGFSPGAILLSNGELVPVPVPEAKTVLAATALLLALGWKERRCLSALTKTLRRPAA